MMGLRNEKFNVSTPEELVALTITMVRRKIARVWRRMQRQQRLDGDSTDSNEVVDLLVELVPIVVWKETILSFENPLRSCSGI